MKKLNIKTILNKGAYDLREISIKIEKFQTGLCDRSLNCIGESTCHSVCVFRKESVA